MYFQVGCIYQPPYCNCLLGLSLLSEISVCFNVIEVACSYKYNRYFSLVFFYKFFVDLVLSPGISMVQYWCCIFLLGFLFEGGGQVGSGG